MTRILALDLGTTMGWATFTGTRITSGSESFKPGNSQGPGARYLKLRRWLSDTKAANGTFDLVVVERVVRHVSADSAHVYGGFLAHVQAWCEHHGMRLEAYSPGTIKKFATGRGNADKAAMIEAAKAAGYFPKDDNEADAIALMRLVLRGTLKAEPA